ncbi:MAG: PDZ domain-containing protein [Anaerolineae bacterium]|nr:PDZ domain-containing protein [Anaerolineae bacterium]MCX8067139.1 PDZ domain-containing protein [Anaerolineae bacterium]MDW7991934.1 PDZ domain-containing protein [Anaerolineae bacterium]
MEKEQITLTGWHIVGIAIAALVLAAGCCVLGGLVGGVVGFGLGQSAAPSIEVPTIVPLPTIPPPEIEVTPPAGERPYLGIRYIARARGAEVQEVIPGSPAEEAGLQVGDLITAVNGERVTAARPLAEILASYRPGDRVTLTVEREGKELKIPVTLGRRP